jgi:hypothetical protein
MKKNPPNRQRTRFALAVEEIELQITGEFWAVGQAADLSRDVDERPRSCGGRLHATATPYAGVFG